jgi:uncharacterized membrane protein
MAASFSITRVTSFWGQLSSSFWFVPAVMAVVAVALSFVFIEVDTLRDVAQTYNPRAFYTFGPEGARTMLSVIASSMITVASLIFSVTMLSLQLASSQFGPRTLGNFMRDRGNQIVLGTFIATFLYCLFVLRSVRGTEGSSFVPHLAVGFGVLMAAASVAVLLYFIHHIATSIRVETLLEKLAVEGCAAVDHIFPERLGHGPANEAAGQTLPYDFEADSRQIPADSDGYVQYIGGDVLMRIATKNDLVLSISARPGVFVTQGGCVIAAYPKAWVSDKIEEDLRGAVVIGRDRTPYQDLEFAIRRIVELAQRSLSPGINDPTTALYCIDRLGQVFGRMADRDIPSPMRLDQSGELRVVTEVFDLGHVTCRAFAAIARYGMTDADVVTRLAETLAKLEKSFPLDASVAVAELREQVLCESGGPTVHAFDRKTLLDLQESSAKKP